MILDDINPKTGNSKNPERKRKAIVGVCLNKSNKDIKAVSDISSDGYVGVIRKEVRMAKANGNLKAYFEKYGFNVSANAEGKDSVDFAGFAASAGCAGCGVVGWGVTACWGGPCSSGPCWVLSFSQPVRQIKRAISIEQRHVQGRFGYSSFMAITLLLSARMRRCFLRNKAIVEEVLLSCLLIRSNDVRWL